MQSLHSHFDVFGTVWIIALMIGAICGYVGTFVVIRRLAFLAETIGHSAIAGVGLGIVLGVMPAIAVIPFSVTVALILTYLSRHKGQDLVGASAAIYSTSVGLGIILLSLSGAGSLFDVLNILFGDLLWLELNHLILLLALGLPATAFIAHQRRSLILMFMNEDLARTGNINVERLDYLFMASIAIIIGISINLVGIVLVTGLLTIPALISGRLANSLKQQLMLSPIIATLSAAVGVAGAFYFDLPPGASIVMVSGLIYLIVVLIPRKKY